MRCAACLQLLQHHSAAQRGALAILGGQRAPVHPVPSPTRGTRALSSSPPLQHAVPATAGPHTRNAAAAAHASLSSAAPQLTVGPPAQQQPRPRSAALPRAQQHQPYLAARSLAAGAMARNSSNAAAEASPRPRPAIQRLHRAAERHLVGRRGQPPSPEQLHELRQLAGEGARPLSHCRHVNRWAAPDSCVPSHAPTVRTFLVSRSGRDAAGAGVLRGPASGEGEMRGVSMDEACRERGGSTRNVTSASALGPHHHCCRTRPS